MSATEDRWFSDNFDAIPVAGTSQPQPAPVKSDEPQLDEWTVLQVIKQAGGSVSPFKFHAQLGRADISLKQVENLLWEHAGTDLLDVLRGPAPPGTHPAELTIHADIFRRNPDLKRAIKQWTAQVSERKTQQTLKPQQETGDRVDAQTLLDLFQ